MNHTSAAQRFLARFRPVSIRDRLLVAFLLIVLIPVAASGLLSGYLGLERGRQQVIDKLQSVAVLKEAELTTWASNVQTDLATVTIGEGVEQYMQLLLLPSSDAQDRAAAYLKLHQHFDRFVDNTDHFSELLLLNVKRRVVFSTDRSHEGAPGTPTLQSYFDRGIEGEYLNPPSYTLATLTGKGVGMDVVRPVYSEDGRLLGVLAGRTSPARLSQIMQERTGLGETGETYLVAANHVMLTEPRFPVQSFLGAYYVFSQGAKAALENHVNGSGVYVNHRDTLVIGVYRWLPALRVALLAEQAEQEAMATVYDTFLLNIAVAIAALAVAVGISANLARGIAVPLSELAQTAGRVSNGELDLVAPVTRQDEIGALAQAFNSMTQRLRDLISGLEQRVAERTRTIHHRALQLETSTQVAREITSILDIDELLNRVVTLLAGTFDYYHVGIYLVDKGTGELVFRAGGGQVDSPRQIHNTSLEIGPGSLNGEVARTNETIVVNDVRMDPRFLADPMLPATRSELVVPLRVGEQVIGTLDVQSTQENTFGQDDVRIIQGLGDQVAIAIENARLYKESRALAVVEERNRLARDLHDSVTQSLYGLVAFAGAGRELMAAGEVVPVQRYLLRIEEAAQQALNEMRLLLYELRPPTLELEGLAGALRQRLGAVEERLGLETSLQVDETLQLPEAMAEGIYRIAQEALNNVVKHSAASSVCVELRRNADCVELEVTDNGVGFDVDSALQASGLGLGGMLDRASEMGGSLAIDSSPGQGARIVLCVRL